MKHKAKSIMIVALSLLLGAGIFDRVSPKVSAEEEPTQYDYIAGSGGITCNGNYGITYAPFNSVSVETVATVNRPEANYGWGAFAAEGFDYEDVSQNANVLVVEMAFPQNDFAYGIQMVGIDKDGTAVNMHTGYGWNAVMDGNTKKSFFRQHYEESASGETGKIYEIPLRAWIFEGLTVGEDEKVLLSNNKKTSFYGNFIFPLENYSALDFKNLDQIIFMSAAANNQSGRFNVGKISLAHLDYSSTVESRPYVIDNSDGSKLTDMNTIWTPSEENAVPYLPASLNGIDDGAFHVTYCPTGLNLTRDKDILTGNDFSLTVPFARELGTKVPVAGMGFYFTVDNTSGPALEYMLRLTDSEDITNIWQTASAVSDEEAYLSEEIFHYTFIDGGTANFYPREGVAFKGSAGIIPAGFSGKIYIPFSENNFVGLKENGIFPETVASEMKILLNVTALETGNMVNLKIETGNIGWQSESAIVPVEPDKDIDDYDLSGYNLSLTNPLDEEATRLHYAKIVKGDCYIELDLEKENLGVIDTKNTIGFAIMVQNTKTANRPFNIKFYDEDGEIFAPGSSEAGVRLVTADGGVSTLEIRNKTQIRLAGNNKGTVVIPWSCLSFLRTTEGGTAPINGKLNKIVKISVDVYPDQPEPSSLEWVIGDYATISKETGALNEAVSVKTSDWNIASEAEDGITILEPLPVCYISYTTNKPEGLFVAQLSAEKVYYPYGDAFLQVIAEEGYEIVRVTLNGEEIDKQGANTYGIGTITGGNAEFYVEVRQIEDSISENSGGEDSSGGCGKGCGSVAAGSGAAAVALIAAGLILKKRKL